MKVIRLRPRFRYLCPYCLYVWESRLLRGPKRCPRCLNSLREVIRLGMVLPATLSPKGEVRIEAPEFFECPYCGHRWRPRRPPRSRYRQCRKCRRCWTIDRQRMRCLKCGYEWTPRRDRPGRCPKCLTRIFYPEGAAAEVLSRALQAEGEEGRPISGTPGGQREQNLYGADQ